MVRDFLHLRYPAPPMRGCDGLQSTVMAPSPKPALPGVIQTAPSPSIIPLSRTKTVSKLDSATTSRRRGLKTVSFAATSWSRLRIVRLAFRVTDKG